MLTNTEIADRLDGAAALIEERGHAKGVTRDDSGAMCLYGAYAFARGAPVNCGGWGVMREAMPFVADALGISPPYQGEYCPGVEWNNAPERTAAEVCALLRRAASLARAAEPVRGEVVAS